MSDKVFTLLDPELVPGFYLNQALGKFPCGLGIERWYAENVAIDSDTPAIAIIVEVWKDQLEAVASLSNSDLMLGELQEGSFSGQPVGDECWCGYPGDRTTRFTVRVGRFAFMIAVRVKGEGHEDDFTEALTKFIVERLKNWDASECGHREPK